MPAEARLLAGLAVSLVIVYVATPFAIRVADRYEFYDRPVGFKRHAANGAATLVRDFALTWM